jgi:hypothetical protein
MGYKAIRAQSGVPGLDTAYGVARGAATSRRPSGLPEEQVWSTEAYLDFVPKLFEAIREGTAWASTCSTTCTTADADRGGEPRQGGSSPTGCSGWRTPRRPKTRRRSA